MSEVAIEEVDLVIVGSGAGGLVAALRAHADGLRVVVLEKQSQVGGSTAMSGGQIWAPANPMQQAAGVSDSPEEALQYLRALEDGNGGAGATPERQRAYVNSVSEVVAFLQDAGVHWRHCDNRSDYYDELPGGKPGGRSLEADLFEGGRLGAWLPRLQGSGYRYPMRGTELRHVLLAQAALSGKAALVRLAFRMALQRVLGKTWLGAGAGMQSFILLACLHRKIPILPDTEVTDLIMEDGRVAGVQIKRAGKMAKIRATRGVLLCAGGFSRSKAMRKRHQPDGGSADFTVANPGDTGEVIEQAVALGAAVDVMDEAWWVPMSKDPSGKPLIHVADLAKPGVILVDQDGHRFVNESGSYMEIGRRMVERNKSVAAIPSWAILDHRARSHYAWGGLLPFQTPKSWKKSGYFKTAGTIEALAAQCNLPPATLRKTVERFNDFAIAGDDADFHRGDRHYDRYYADPTHRPNPCLAPIDKAPFYATSIQLGDVGTAGGLVADELGRVKRTDGSVIPGLFAAGNCTAPVFGRHYPGAGASIGASAVFGYIVARHLSGTNARHEERLASATSNDAL